MGKLYCQNCRQQIPAGGSFYCCRTEIVSGFDGRLPESDLDPDHAIAEACDEIETFSAEEAMDDVYQEIKIILCPTCRLTLRDNLLAMKKPPKKSTKVLKFPPTK